MREPPRPEHGDGSGRSTHRRRERDSGPVVWRTNGGTSQPGRPAPITEGENVAGSRENDAANVTESPVGSTPDSWLEMPVQGWRHTSRNTAARHTRRTGGEMSEAERIARDPETCAREVERLNAEAEK